jgi:hypothetical protein
MNKKLYAIMQKKRYKRIYLYDFKALKELY